MYRSVIPNITDKSMIGEPLNEGLQKPIIQQRSDVSTKPKLETDYTKILYITTIIIVVILIILIIYYFYKSYQQKETKAKDKPVIKPTTIQEKSVEKKKDIPDSILNMDNSILQQYITKNSNKPVTKQKENPRMMEQETISGNIAQRISDNSENIVKSEEKKIQSLKDNIEDNENWDDVEEPISINREEETLLMLQDMMNENKTKVIITVDSNILNNPNILNDPVLLNDDVSDQEVESRIEETCSHIFKSGINKGKRCTSKAIIENKCSKHH